MTKNAVMIEESRQVVWDNSHITVRQRSARRFDILNERVHFVPVATL
jgi:hypothetical protein